MKSSWLFTLTNCNDEKLCAKIIEEIAIIIKEINDGKEQPRQIIPKRALVKRREQRDNQVCDHTHLRRPRN